MPANHSLYQAAGRNGQELLDDVMQLFSDLLAAGGASLSMIESAMRNAADRLAATQSKAPYTEIGSVLRDCMEVMCAWRRDVEFVDSSGEPIPLTRRGTKGSLEALCSKVGCSHDFEVIAGVLLDFGAVSVDELDRLQSRTPTFLLTRGGTSGRLASDGLLKHLQGYLRVVHGNVCSASGGQKRKFERACSVLVARELEPVFDRLVRARGQEFVDSIDEWLERNSTYQSASGAYVELGAGAYYIDFGLAQEVR